jgi:hypothetical protein
LFVLTVKTALVLPAATVTETGAVAAGSLLVSDTETPPAGAVPVNVTVPVSEVPLVTRSVLTLSDDSDTF